MSRALVPTAAIPLPSLATDLESLSLALDGVTHEMRVNWLGGLGRREMRALWDLAEGSSVSVEDLAPAEGVRIHEGKNSMPLFNRFQKRFARLGDQVVGYNHNNALATWFAGPGHYVAYDAEEKNGGVVIDYRTLPSAQHPEFPALRSNDVWFAKLVYGNLVDLLRRVSSHVFIGDSFKGDKPVGVLFSLCRVDAIPQLEVTTDG